MIIECFALTEVGKSTLVNDLSERYGVKFISEQESSLFSAFLFALKHPVSISRLVLLFLKEGLSGKVPWKITRFKLSVLKTTMSRLYDADKKFSDDDIVIIDEGLVQRLFSLYETKQSIDTYLKLIDLIPLSDSILFLEYKGDSARIKQGRVGTMRRSVSEEYTKEWQATMLHNYFALRDALQFKGLLNQSYSRDDKVGFDLDLLMADLKQRLESHLKLKN